LFWFVETAHKNQIRLPDSQKVKRVDKNWQSKIAPLQPAHRKFLSFQAIEEFIQAGIVFAVSPSRR
jgi:hypothetical protein